MNNGQISIIIPVHNSANYLERCLISVSNQTYKNLEIIIIDDGSSDNSLEIIQNISRTDSRMITISVANSGVSAARNEGLSYANGEFIMFVDSDDWIDNDTCEKAVDIIQKNNLDVVMWPYIREYPSKSKETLFLGREEIILTECVQEKIWRRMIGPLKEEMRKPQFVDSMITVWGKLYRHDVIENINFIDIKLVATEDTLYNIEVFQRVKSIAYLPIPFYHYRKTDLSSLTHTYKQEKIRQWQELYRRIEKILLEADVPEHFYDALENRICLGLIGLGLNLIEDKNMSLKSKRKELKKILLMSQYKKALGKLDLQYFPLYWKVYFICMRNERISATLGLLYILNFLRSH